MIHRHILQSKYIIKKISLKKIRNDKTKIIKIELIWIGSLPIIELRVH